MLLSFVLAAPAASARIATDSGYSKEQTYSGALRYLRVDLGYDVTERDPESAYLMFQYVPHGRKESTRGTIEIVETKAGTKLYVQLSEMPEYHEQVLANGLIRKLETDYGHPSKRVGAPKKPSKQEKAPQKPPDGERD